jgi:hypothetical protein
VKTLLPFFAAVYEYQGPMTDRGVFVSWRSLGILKWDPHRKSAGLIFFTSFRHNIHASIPIEMTAPANPSPMSF